MSDRIAGLHAAIKSGGDGARAAVTSAAALWTQHSIGVEHYIATIASAGSGPGANGDAEAAARVRALLDEPWCVRSLAARSNLAVVERRQRPFVTRKSSARRAWTRSRRAVAGVVRSLARLSLVTAARAPPNDIGACARSRRFEMALAGHARGVARGWLVDRTRALLSASGRALTVDLFHRIARVNQMSAYPFLAAFGDVDRFPRGGATRAALAKVGVASSSSRRCGGRVTRAALNNVATATVSRARRGRDRAVAVPSRLRIAGLSHANVTVARRARRGAARHARRARPEGAGVALQPALDHAAEGGGALRSSRSCCRMRGRPKEGGARPRGATRGGRHAAAARGSTRRGVRTARGLFLPSPSGPPPSTPLPFPSLDRPLAAWRPREVPLAPGRQRRDSPSRGRGSRAPRIPDVAFERRPMGGWGCRGVRGRLLAPAFSVEPPASRRDWCRD